MLAEAFVRGVKFEQDSAPQLKREQVDD